MYIIVGLGNPGREYEHTRHNAGFDVISLLSEKYDAPLNKAHCKALTAQCRIGGEQVVLAKPQTYMNLSGESVVQLMNWYKVEPDHLIVCYDDIDLDPGRIRVRAGGSSGTHNGMRNIIYLLGRDDFPRVRVGTGRPDPRWSLADFVLSHYDTPELQKTMNDAFREAAGLIETLITEGIDAAVRACGKSAAQNAPKKASKPRYSFGALVQEINRRIEQNYFSGAVCQVSKENNIIYSGALGLESPETGKKMQRDTLFRLASCTKTFTAAAIMILADRGKLRLSDPVADYLPDFEHMRVFTRDENGKVTGTEPANRLISLHDLLTHSSGLGQDEDGCRAWAEVEKNIPDEEYDLAHLAAWSSQVPLSFQPGTRSGYSPILGFNALAAVVEKVSGMRYGTFLDIELFAPLGMGETTHFPSESQWARVACVTDGETGAPTSPAAGLTFSQRLNYEAGSVGLCTTVGDYMRFAQMLANGGVFKGARILSEESVRAMCAPQLPDGLPGQEPYSIWGYGLHSFNKTNAEQPLPVGSVDMAGAYGTYLFIDFEEKLCCTMMMAKRGGIGSMRLPVKQLVLDAVRAAEIKP